MWQIIDLKLWIKMQRPKVRSLIPLEFCDSRMRVFHNPQPALVKQDIMCSLRSSYYEYIMNELALLFIEAGESPEPEHSLDCTTTEQFYKHSTYISETRCKTQHKCNGVCNVN